MSVFVIITELLLTLHFSLLDICSISSRHDLHKLIVASLDFAHDVLARVILEKLLTSGDVVSNADYVTVPCDEQHNSYYDKS